MDMLFSRVEPVTRRQPRRFEGLEGSLLMMRERIAEDIYCFSSDVYAQVNAGAVVTPEGTLLIDTLATPGETRGIEDFLEHRLGSRVRYLVNTHYHADHSSGSYLFPGATIVTHALSRGLLDTRGRQGLGMAKAENREFSQVQVVLPEITFAHGTLALQMGKRTMRILALPGHSPDGIGVLVEEDRILFSGDAVMPLPHIRDGDVGTQVRTLRTIASMGLENIVQGHGEVILRGEIDELIGSHITYLERIEREVLAAVRRGWTEMDLQQITIEKCGKSRILLNGLASELHWQNLLALHRRFASGAPPATVSAAPRAASSHSVAGRARRVTASRRSGSSTSRARSSARARHPQSARRKTSARATPARRRAARPKPRAARRAR
jgi:glyoxylase-like metal-dependent hydrolase (beta-lactamase superfamily II)